MPCLTVLLFVYELLWGVGVHGHVILPVCALNMEILKISCGNGCVQRIGVT